MEWRTYRTRMNRDVYHVVAFFGWIYLRGEWSQCLVCSAESEDRSVSVLQCLSGIDRTGDREDVSR